MPDISEQVSKIIAKNKKIAEQFENTRHQMTILMDMINMELRKQKTQVDSYTLTVHAQSCMPSISYWKQ